MKKTMKRVLSLVLCAVVAFSAVCITASGASTPTLNKHTLFIDGYSEGGKFIFKPDVPMKRSEAIKVLAVVARHTDSFNPDSVKTSFTDLTGSEWYATYVKYLEKYDMLDFWGTTLNADKGITRAEFVKLISPYIPSKSGSKSFPDVPSTHPYYSAIIAAAKAGIVEGNPDGTFNPDGTLTRAQIVTIIDRLIGRNIVESNAVKVEKFSDIKGHWAEKYIVAASSNAKTDGAIIWYSGNAYSANSTKDVSKFDYSTTEAIFKGINKDDDAAVEKAVEAYAEKRKQEILNTKTEITAAAGKKTYYVSADGNDANDGLTPESAWKTLNKVSNASLKNGDVVYFRRGDTFRGSLATKYGVTYSAYGEGAKPNLYASPRNYSESDFWEATDKKNVYVSKDGFAKDVGAIFFDEGAYVTNKKAKGINGTSLILDLDMYHNTEDNKLYLYSISDPDTRFKSTEIGVNINIVSGNGSKVTLDNLAIKYTGAYGAAYSSGTSGLTIQNCEFAWIGGRLHQNSGWLTRAGNAIEIYGACNNFTVKNCYIYQIYDTGITHQYWGTSTNLEHAMENIKYSDNVIEKCTWNIEFVNGLPNGLQKNVEISGNLLLKAGEGWGSQRQVRSDASLNGWGGESATNNTKDFYIYDNVVSATDENAVVLKTGTKDRESMPVIVGNIFMGKKNNVFGSYGAGDDYAEKKFNDNLTKTTIGLDNNTFVYSTK